MSDIRADAASEPVKDRADRRAWAATWLGALGAVAMTSCCILPLVLVGLGVTGVFIGQLAALYAYKWLTFGISAAFLGYGFWKAYRPAAPEACAGGTCVRPVGRRAMRAVLWLAALVVAVALLFPAFAPHILRF